MRIVFFPPERSGGHILYTNQLFNSYQCNNLNFSIPRSNTNKYDLNKVRPQSFALTPFSVSKAKDRQQSYLLFTYLIVIVTHQLGSTLLWFTNTSKFKKTYLNISLCMN